MLISMGIEKIYGPAGWIAAGVAAFFLEAWVPREWEERHQ
jgi:hypothetical protein